MGALAVLTGITSALDGSTALRGPRSVLRMEPWETRMRTDPALGERMLETAALVRTESVRQLGLEIGANSPEYPWWVLLGDLDLVPVGATVPTQRGALVDRLDALLCARQYGSCLDVVPDGWRAVGDERVLVAFRPAG